MDTDISISVAGTGFNRILLLQNSIKILSKMEQRLLAVRFKEHEGDKEYLAFARAYATILSTVNTVARDMEIEDLQKQIDELKGTQGSI